MTGCVWRAARRACYFPTSLSNPARFTFDLTLYSIMAGTTLKVHLAEPDRIPETFTMQATDSGAAPIRTLIFRSTEVIHDSNSKVYRGILSGYDSSDRTVVCKLAPTTHKTLQWFNREARMYQGKLSCLQGKTIPRFFGLYSQTEGYRPMLCLLLEDCGTAIGSFENMDMHLL